ncbi:MAG: 30S ribosomal protein S12 methylthiotransferase RimO [Candidatus Krumholzibacteria bacterium]|nr:30S ribosomal protein S12 methylthiotransferase RimO [Candidatus Krumholzibacteria bacterium]MDP7020795.1 30S ribosomal protein S12 methylthiotransferase RimO [Candidatus Krumholzibacteria bacterium]
MNERLVYLESLGCSKNLVDSEATLGFLLKAGYRLQADPDAADLILLNTCGFVEDAKRQSIERILELAEFRKSGTKLVVFGCLSQRYAESLKEEMPEIDLLAGVGQQKDLAAAIDLLFENGHSLSISPAKPRISFEGFRDRPLLTPSHMAWVKVGEGCSHACSFCAIPAIRGKFESRKLEDIVEESEILVSRGVGEINLISQDTAYFGREAGAPNALRDLLQKLSAISHLRWIRLFYFHPALVTAEDLLRIFDIPRVLPYLDLPIQHASDSMLQIMRRGHDRSRLSSMIRKLRRERPDLTLRTSVLLGHPGETEEDFGELLEFLEEHPFDKLGIFEFSAEEGTHATDLPGRVEEALAAERADRLRMFQMPISEDLSRKQIGKTMTGVVEATASAGEGLPPERRLHLLESSPFPASKAVIRTERDAYEVDAVLFSDEERELALGQWVKVEVEDADVYDLKGRVIGPASP